MIKNHKKYPKLTQTQLKPLQNKKKLCKKYKTTRNHKENGFDPPQPGQPIPRRWTSSSGKWQRSASYAPAAVATRGPRKAAKDTPFSVFFVKTSLFYGMFVLLFYREKNEKVWISFSDLEQKYIADQEKKLKGAVLLLSTTKRKM